MTISRHRLSGGRHLGAGRLVRLIQDELKYVQSGAGTPGPGDPCIDNPTDPECCDTAASLLDGLVETDSDNIYSVDHIAGASAGGGQPIFENTVFGIGSIDYTVPSAATIFSENNKNLSNAASNNFSPSYSIGSNLGYARFRKGKKVNDPFPTGKYEDIKKIIKSVPRVSVYYDDYSTLNTALNEGGIDYSSDEEIIRVNTSPITRDRGVNDPRLNTATQDNDSNTAAAGFLCTLGCGVPGSAECVEFCNTGVNPANCTDCPVDFLSCDCLGGGGSDCTVTGCPDCFSCLGTPGNQECQQTNFSCGCPGSPTCAPCTVCTGAGSGSVCSNEIDCNNPDNASCPQCDPCASCASGQACCDGVCTTTCVDGSCPPCDVCASTSAATLVGGTPTEIRGNFARRDLHSVAFFQHDLNQGDATYQTVGSNDVIVSCVLELTVKDVYGRLDHTAATPRVNTTKYNVHKIINTDFDPAYATYKYSAGSTVWATEFARGASDRDATPSSSFTINDSVSPRQRISIDITKLAQDAAANNNGIINFLIESDGEYDATTGNTLTTNRKDRPSQLVQFYSSGQFKPRVILNVYRGRRSITQMKLPWQR